MLAADHVLLKRIAILIMVASGWRIYDARRFSGSSSRVRSRSATDSGALQWHFAAMGLLVVSGLFYVTRGIVTGRFGAQLLFRCGEGSIPRFPGAALRRVHEWPRCC